MSNEHECAECGMAVSGSAEFHPYLACMAMKHCHDSKSVRANLSWVVQYGMRAERAGVTIEQAMENFGSVMDEADNE